MGALKLKEELIDDLKSLHQVITKNYHSENDLFKEYLSVGKRIFQLETGIISRIKDDNYTILSFSSPLDGLENNQTFSLEETYCREVYKAKKTVAIPHIGANAEMCNHPVYINMKLESYISSPIFVHGKIYGTINFTDRSVRLKDFTIHQFELIEIMANTISRFIEAKLTKEKLRSANEMINRLVGVVAHDLKNPLGNIISLSHLIGETTQEEETKEYIDLIKISSESSVEIVESILDMSAIESGKIKINKSENSILNLAKDSWAITKHLAYKKSISCKIEGDDFNISLDYERMKQTLCNLITNAIKFSKENSSIILSWQVNKEKILLQIKDNGVGMTPEQIKFAFDPTKTTSTIGTAGEIGTGYGLPLVAKIISYHDGTINIESNKQSGTTFKIELPIE